MRRSRRSATALAAFLAVSVTWAVGGGTGAGAEDLDAYGWWSRAQTLPSASPVTVPPPPSQVVPADGMAVQMATVSSPPDPTATPQPVQPVAVSALRFTGIPEDADVTLLLDAAEGSLTDAPAPTPQDTTARASLPIAACVLDSKAPTWDGEQFGKWDNKPVWDCESLAADGVAEEAGTRMSWQLSPLFQQTPGVLDIVLVPQGSSPFSVAFNAPASDAITVTGGGTGGDVDSLGPSDDTDASSGFDDSTATLPDATSADVAADAGALPLADVTDEMSALPATAETPAGDTAAIALGRPRSARILGPFKDTSRSERIMAVSLLGLMLAALWWFGSGHVRAPRLLGSLGAAGGRAPASVHVGGVGRFTRPRSGRPNHL